MVTRGRGTEGCCGFSLRLLLFIAHAARLELEEDRKDAAQEKFSGMNNQSQDPFSQIALGNM